MTDDTAYVQAFIDRGELIPSGTYDCPGGLEIPADYIDRAVRAGREDDASHYALGDGDVRCNWNDGGWARLGGVEPTGNHGDARIFLGRDGYGMYMEGSVWPQTPSGFCSWLGDAAQERNKRLVAGQEDDGHE